MSAASDFGRPWQLQTLPLVVASDELGYSAALSVMRVVRIILATLALPLAFCACVLLAAWLGKSPYLRFVEKDQKYFAKVARACDLMLKRHPLGTNEYVRIDGRDASIPKVLRDLGSERITISPNRVHVMVGVRDFGMSWKAQEEDTNSWALEVAPPWQGKALYVEKQR